MTYEAKAIAKEILEKKKEINKKRYIQLKRKAISELNLEKQKGNLVFEIELSEEDLHVLETFAEELRRKDYKYALIEKEDAGGNILGHRLRISLKHLVKDLE